LLPFSSSSAHGVADNVGPAILSAATTPTKTTKTHNFPLLPLCSFGFCATFACILFRQVAGGGIGLFESLGWREGVVVVVKVVF